MRPSRAIFLSLFFIFLIPLIVSPPSLPPVEAQPVGDETADNQRVKVSTVWREFPYIEPHLVETNTHYIYVTDWGNYSFSKLLPYICRFTFRDKTELISRSMFWINTSKILLPRNPEVVKANDTYFEVRIEARQLLKTYGWLTVSYNFDRPDRPKISVRFEKNDAIWDLGDFNIKWVIVGRSGATTHLIDDVRKAVREGRRAISVNRTGLEYLGRLKQVEVGPSDDPDEWRRWLIVDWSDEGVADVRYGEVTIGETTFFGVRVDFERNDSEIDPSTVGNSDINDATYYSYSRKTFYAAGRYWVFWVSDQDLYYASSSDGSTWTSPAVAIGSKPLDGEDASVWFDGTYVYCVATRDGATGTVTFRRGTPSSGGSISWSASDGFSDGASADKPTIAVDGDGYAWIGKEDKDTDNTYVAKNDRNDGSWSTDFIETLDTDTYETAIPIPLTGTKMAFIWAKGSGVIHVRSWDGSNFGTEVTASGTDLEYGTPSITAVANGDTVHIVYEEDDTGAIKYLKYYYSSNSFSSTTTIRSQRSGPYCETASITLDPDTGDLYVFWISEEEDKIYCKHYDASEGSWGEAEVVVEESINIEGLSINTWYKVANNEIGIVYTTSSSPYEIRFAIYTLNQASNAPTLNSPSDSERFDIGESVTFTWTFNDPDDGDSQGAYRFQLDDNSDFSSPIIDTGKVSSSSTSTTQTLPSSVGTYYWRVKTWDDSDAEGPWSSGRAIIADRIKVLSITTPDTRVNVGTSVTIMVSLVYESDGSAITSGSFTLEGLTLTYQSGDDWTCSDSSSSVTAKTYDSVSGSVGNVDNVNMNGQSLTVIWDRIHSTAISASDTRVNVGDSVNIDVTLKYDYDETAVTTGTVTINGISASHQGSGVWRITVSKSSVTSATYGDSISVSGDDYGITATSADAGTVTIIWDRVNIALNGLIGYWKLDEGSGTTAKDSSGLENTMVFKNSPTWVTGKFGYAVELADADSDYLLATIDEELVLTSFSLEAWFKTTGTDNIGNFLSINAGGAGSAVAMDSGYVKGRLADSGSVLADVVSPNTYDDGEWHHAVFTYDGSTLRLYVDGVEVASTSYSHTITGVTTMAKIGVGTGAGFGYFTGLLDEVCLWNRALSPEEVAARYHRNVHRVVNVGSSESIEIDAYYEYDHTSFSGSVTLNDTASKSVVGKYGFKVSSISDNNYGLTEFTTGETTIIWDRVKVSSLTASDTRTNVGSSVNVDASLVYEYDNSAVTDGSVSIEGISASHQGGGTWRISVSKSSVQAVTYDSITISGNSYGLTAVNMNGKSVTVIWDRLEIYSVSASDTRVNVGDSVELRYKIRYDYDDEVFDSSDGSVSIAGVSASWDSANGWWEATITQPSSVTSTNYDEQDVSVTDNKYGLTAKNDVAGINVITDRIKVSSITVSDSRTNVGSSVNIDATLVYEYDGTPVTDGSVSIEGVSATHQGSGVWRISQSKSSVQAVTYDSVSASGNQYGITAINMNGQSATVIWDKLTLFASDSRVGTGDSVTISWTITRQYDSSTVSDFSIIITEDGASWYSGSASSSSVSHSSVGKWTYTCSSVTDNTYDLTVFDTNSVDVIWDRLIVTLSVDDSRLDVGSSATISWSVIYDYDDTAEDSFSITVNRDGSAWYSGLASSKSDSFTSVGAHSYTVGSITGNTYDIDSFTSNTVTVIWDRLEVYDYGTSDDRCDVGSTQTVWYKLRYDYDDEIFDSSDGSVTIGGATATWNSAESRWEISTSKSTVGSYSYPLSFTDSKYGLTAITGTTTQSIIFDRVNIDSFSVADNHINVGDTASFSASGTYEYDGATWSGLFTLNDTASKSIVGRYVYTISSITDDNYGLTAFEMTAFPVAVIFDKLSITLTADDDRIDVGSTASISYTITHQYDNTPSQASITLNDTLTKNTVGKYRYTVASVSGDEYGITAFDSNSVDIIFDKIIVDSLTVSDSRIDVGATAEILASGHYAYDSSPWSGDFTLNDTLTKSEVGKYWYHVTSVTDPLYGLTAFEQAAPDVYVIFDRIDVDLFLTDDRIDVGEEMPWSYAASYAYDGADASDYVTITLNDTTTKDEVGKWVFTVESVSDSLYGLTTFTSDNIECIWDRVKITLTVTDDRIDVGSQADIQKTAVYAYDNTPFQGTIYLNDTTVKEMVGRYGFKASSISDPLYGLTAFTTNEVSVIYDRVNIDLTIPDQRIDIGSTMTWSFTALYEYDGANATPYITPTLNDTLTKDSVGKYWFTVSSISDSKYGLTTFVADSEYCIWDRLEIVSVSVNDSRVGVGYPYEVRYVIRYDYDDAPFTDAEGSVEDFTYDSTHGWWSRMFYAPQTVGVVEWDEEDISITDSKYGLTVKSDISPVQVIVDRLLLSFTLNDTRVTVEDPYEVSVSIIYDYDDTPFTSSDGSLEGFTYNSSTGLWKAVRYAPSSTGAYPWSHLNVTISDNKYGIKALATSQPQTLIADRVVVTLSTSKTKVAVGSTVTVWAVAYLEYDNHTLGAEDRLVINGYNFTWDESEQKWRWDHAEGSTTSITLDTITPSRSPGTYEATYGIRDGVVLTPLTITWASGIGGGGGGGGGVVVPFTPPPSPPPTTTTPTQPPTAPAVPMYKWEPFTLGLVMTIGALISAIAIGEIRGRWKPPQKEWRETLTGLFPLERSERKGGKLRIERGSLFPLPRREKGKGGLPKYKRKRSIWEKD